MILHLLSPFHTFISSLSSINIYFLFYINPIFFNNLPTLSSYLLQQTRNYYCFFHSSSLHNPDLHFSSHERVFHIPLYKLPTCPSAKPKSNNHDLTSSFLIPHLYSSFYINQHQFFYFHFLEFIFYSTNIFLIIASSFNFLCSSLTLWNYEILPNITTIFFWWILLSWWSLLLWSSVTGFKIHIGVANTRKTQ